MQGPVGDSRVHAGDLRWMKKQKPPEGDQWVIMGSLPHSRVHVEQSPDGRGLDLVFRSIKSADRGEYKCMARLNGRDKERIFNLNVIEPISFEKHAAFSGNPKPEITWNVRGRIIRGGGQKYEVLPTGLLIRNITKSDEGAYQCKATQSADAEAEPPAQFRWLDKNNNEVEHGNVINQGHKSLLSISIDHDDLFGDYTCIAKNKMGTLRKVVTLTEGAKPGIPFIEIHEIDHKSAKMKIQEPKAELFLGIMGFKVEYKLKSQEWENATHEYFDKKRTGDDTSNLIILQTNDEHSVRELISNDSSLLSPSSTTSSISRGVPIVISVIQTIISVRGFLCYRIFASV
ncbi:unnamed protein product [Lepeophtheirus salmonis]|uniref:(salmon louse) hypothetical protein n=1 Tax=Lepeophtheirus salmonis TaxID=72036 RepID=A0A7R8CES2_LEPSM|nr:unnamed protein product [Lepeophtheirus salmonis]CAF2798179.1 unnamed protein product [Lepeophtheirus salmonis]